MDNDLNYACSLCAHKNVCRYKKEYTKAVNEHNKINNEGNKDYTIVVYCNYFGV